MNLYAIHFDDNRVKVGVTSNITKRMSYYAQEGRRNRLSGFTWFAAGGLHTKSDALLLERVLCNALKDLAIQGHREWIEGDAKMFGEVISAISQLRKSINPSACGFTDDKWGRFDLQKRGAK